MKREYLSSAAWGALASLGLPAVVSLAGWVLYLPGWIDADAFVALEWAMVISAASGVFLGFPLAVAVLWFQDHRHRRRRPRLARRPHLELLDTATVEVERSHQRTGAIEPFPGAASTPAADYIPATAAGRRRGASTRAGGGPRS